MNDIDTQSVAWDSHWTKRVLTDKVQRNVGKFNILLDALWHRNYYAPFEKLDIGCGPGSHALHLGQFNPYWIMKWTGVDLAESGIAKAKEGGLNAIQGNIYEMTFDKRFELFLLLDSLEHFEDHEALAEKVKELAADDYFIFGNCPLYHTDPGSNGYVEVPITAGSISRFLSNAGCPYQQETVYGVNGFPYIMFEASNKERHFGRWF